MKILSFLPGLAVLCGLASAQPAADLWVVKADPATAGFIEKAVDEGKLGAEEIEARLLALVKQGKVSEVARFTKDFEAPAAQLRFEKDVNEVKIGDGDLAPTGIVLNAEPYVGAMGLVDLRFDYDHAVSVAENRIDLDRTQSAAVVAANRWEIIASWTDGKATSLFLAHFSAPGKDPDQVPRTIREVTLRTELVLCAAEDLTTFGRSTPATRAKATVWLRGRGELAGGGTVRFLSGQKSFQQDLVQWIHNRNGWDTADLGLTWEAEAQVGPHARLADIQVQASWHPREAPQPPAGPLVTFRAGETVASGGTVVVAPEARPAAGPVPVLFLSPVVRSLQEAEEQDWPTPEAGPDDFVTRRHDVHPSFMRKLVEVTGFNVNPEPNRFVVPRPGELLEKLGVPFPAQARVAFDANRCEVLLVHTKAGDEAFLKVLKDHGLEAPEKAGAGGG